MGNVVPRFRGLQTDKLLPSGGGLGDAVRAAATEGRITTDKKDSTSVHNNIIIYVTESYKYIYLTYSYRYIYKHLHLVDDLLIKGNAGRPAVGWCCSTPIPDGKV